MALLPYLDRPDLYKAIHLDEPWDSEHNKPLLAQMPKLFSSSAAENSEDGRTRYLVPTGKGTMFEGQEGIKLTDVPDGTSNTLLIVEVGPDKAVEWTKPDDLAVDMDKPAAGLGEIPDEGFLAAFADGSVQLIKKSVDPETLRRLFIRSDGQPIDPSKF